MRYIDVQVGTNSFCSINKTLNRINAFYMTVYMDCYCMQPVASL